MDSYLCILKAKAEAAEKKRLEKEKLAGASKPMIGDGEEEISAEELALLKVGADTTSTDIPHGNISKGSLALDPAQFQCLLIILHCYKHSLDKILRTNVNVMTNVALIHVQIQMIQRIQIVM